MLSGYFYKVRYGRFLQFLNKVNQITGKVVHYCSTDFFADISCGIGLSNQTTAKILYIHRVAL